jgi:phosphoglycerate dehydrogenase-like enzyme
MASAKTSGVKIVIAVRHPFELWNAPAWVSERLRAEFPQMEVIHLPDYKGLDKEIVDADVFVGWSLRAEQLRAAKKLRWIHSPAAAVHQLMIPELVASDVQVTNAAEVHGPVVAEHAIAVMLALAKRLPSAVRYQEKHIWCQEQLWNERPRLRELAGSTLLLLGLGNIGGNVASRAVALGMRVVAVREHPGNRMEHVEVYGSGDLDNLVVHSDFVVLAAPLTERTRHIINADRLRRMKPECYLINVARGQLIDDTALVEALRSRRVGGAALDVFTSEPLPADSPYWDLENVLITPHSAALTERLWERHYALIADNLRRFLAGEPLRAVVDKRSGY